MSDQRDSRFPDLRYIRELARVFKQYELGEIEIEAEDARILLRKQDLQAAGVVAGPAPVPAPVAGNSAANSGPEPAGGSAPAVQPAPAGVFITSPFVGTFYSKPKPDAPTFAKPGDKISKGQTICIVEAMKLFNEIETEFDCVVEETLVEDGHPVEFGANLFRVRKL